MILAGLLASALAAAFAVLAVAVRRGVVPIPRQSVRLGEQALARALQLDRLIAGRAIEAVEASRTEIAIFLIAAVSAVLMGIAIVRIAFG